MTDNAALKAPSIAVAIPCLNEAATVARVVAEFRAELPGAEIIVFDNASADASAEEARKAGARVVHVPARGKGHVVRAIFDTVRADVCVMVDADGTYPAGRVHSLVAPVAAGEADMACGSRLMSGARSDFKPMNRIGNRIFVTLVNTIFGIRLTDLLTGYRAMSARCLREVTVLSRGFEVETEMTFKAIARGLRIVEMPVDLAARAEGSRSKVRLVRDGLIIFNAIFTLMRDHKPFTAFGGIGVVMCLSSIVPGYAAIEGMPSRGGESLWLAALAAGLFVLGAGSFFSGLILHSIARKFQETEARLARGSKQ